MADVVDGAGDAPTVEQESRSFELPTEEAPADATEETEPAAEDAASPPADDEETKSALPTSTDELPPASEVPAKAAGAWNQLLSKVHPVVRKHAETVANHPYVTATASTLRQRAGQAQEQMKPIVNHPYVQKGTQTIMAGSTKTLETGKKVSQDKRVVYFLIATIGLVGLSLIIRVLLQKYPEFGADLKMKLMKKDEL